MWPFRRSSGGIFYPELLSDWTNLGSWTAVNAPTVGFANNRIQITSTAAAPNPYIYRRVVLLNGATYMLSADIYQDTALNTTRVNADAVTAGNASFGHLNIGLSSSMTFIATAAGQAFIALVPAVNAIGQMAEFANLSLKRIK